MVILVILSYILVFAFGCIFAIGWVSGMFVGILRYDTDKQSGMANIGEAMYNTDGMGSVIENISKLPGFNLGKKFMKFCLKR